MDSKKPKEIDKHVETKDESVNFNLDAVKADKTNPIKDLMHKFKYSFQGFLYCYTHETSFIFETIALIAAIICGFLADIQPHQWVFSLISLFLITEIEFLNTAIEATVDMVTSKYHPLAKVAKDCGSASTFMASLIAVIVHIWIYVPILWKLFF